MKSGTLVCITAMTLFAALAIPVRLRVAAQEQPTTQQDGSTQAAQAQHVRYKLVDLGTFGGPASNLSNPAAHARSLIARVPLLRSVLTP